MKLHSLYKEPNKESKKHLYIDILQHLYCDIVTYGSVATYMIYLKTFPSRKVTGNGWIVVGTSLTLYHVELELV